ncbi:hypothetical protein J2X47_003593 [Sphingomonas sp. BE270]|jgi:hypothetical protein|uniref:hypothetical protein n=1 Tax=unclassified Sphingomonas TaxID=196159 RepID=UPI00053D6686|nr:MULTISPECIES: hypothetical protein [unclassified Sphingomonas]MDR6849131.1 hypothetical protein [Sphingomonas sp. BE137]MDR7259392.1 hypothetical protein [Sphingomonas sp. BE270]
MTRPISSLSPALGLAAIAALATAPAHADERKSSITPYIEIGQVVTADLKNDDVLTYSTVAAGVDASVQTKRTQLQVSYRYERRFSYSKKVGDDDVHSGLARASVRVAPGVTLEGGAIATRVRSDIRGAAPGNLAGNVDNISQVYSAYVGPTVASHVGPVGVAASYRFGFTKAEAPGATGVAPGSPKLDVFDTSQSHVFNASAGVKAGAVLPVGVNVSAGYERDTAGQLDQKYESKVARGDLVLPILPTLAVTGGAGYEKITVSQKDPLKDANGVPVTDSRGRFQTDPASPTRIAYQTDGLIYDAGVIWRPSPRTALQARAGRRYGGMTYTGSFSYAASKSIGIQIGVYDSVDTFGRQLREGISNLPTSFIDQRDAFAQQFSGCTFGTSSAAAGGCLNGVFQSISTSAYRARGVDAVIAAKRGALSFGIGGGYAQRRFYAPSGTGFSIDGVTDDSYYAQAYVSAPIDRNSGVSGNVFANYYESGISAAPGVFSTGATALYYHNFGRIATTASAGLYSFTQKGTEDQLSAQGQVGVRYQF